jgi:hypothetical protein
MNIFKQWEKNIHKMHWYDIGLLKIYIFFFTLFLITIWPDFTAFVLTIDWYWYLIAAILVALPVIKKFYF